MKRLILASVTLTAMATMATPPEVSNVRASQRTDTKLVDIYYDATDADGDLLKVRVEISDNDGVKYSVPAFSLTGDIGEGIAPGTGKHIVWDAGTDWDGEYSDKMRVKVFAIDAQGFPGMEWSNEVKPGGFLLGQDGGAEGSGESQHVNIKWSYWIGKYEVTAQQYCDFLNAAIVAGIVGRNGTESVYASDMMPITYGCPADAILCSIGDNWCIRWNVNNFEVVSGWENKPAIVTWYGAMAFCRFYGYDLPTEAEWEKAARGPDNDDQDEHLLYPWGNACSSAQAYTIYSSTYSQLSGLSSVSSYDAQINGYGICDVVGNAAEWTRSSGEELLDDYPTIESLLDDRQLPYVRVDRVVKGIGASGLYYRRDVDEAQVYCSTNNYSRYFFIGFRPVRRSSEVEDVVLSREVFEDFDTITTALKTFTHNGKTWKTTCSDYSGDYDNYKCFRQNIGVNDSGAVHNIVGGYISLYLPTVSGRLCFVRLKAKNTDSSTTSISVYSSLGQSQYVGLPKYMDTFKLCTLPVVMDAEDYSIDFNSSLYFDEIELWTIPKK